MAVMQHEIKTSLNVSAGPSVEPVTLAEAKSHMRVTHTDEDELITAWITAGRAECEKRCNRTFINQVYQLTMDRFPTCEIILPRPPIVSASTVTYIDTDGASQTISSGNYILDATSEPGRITPIPTYSWPSTQDRMTAVTVTYTAGYGASVSSWKTSGTNKYLGAYYLVRSAICLMVEHFRRNRGESEARIDSGSATDLAVDGLLSSLMLPEFH